MRSVPDTLAALWRRSVVSASRSSTSARPCSANRRPSGVGCRRRVVRCSRRTPSPRSSRFRRWLATATDRSRLRAAALIEPRSSTRRNKVRSSSRSTILNRWLKAIRHPAPFRRKCNRLACALPTEPRPMKPPSRRPTALVALAAGAFGIGTTEFVIMGLLLQVGSDLHVGIAAAGLLISGYALGVFVGAPLLTAASSKLPRKTVLLGLMAIFTLGNLACALAPNYGVLMAARVLTSLAHGTFFGVGSVVATGLVAADRRASAISLMFTGLTLATLLGVPTGTWLGHLAGWRATFWAVAAIGVVALAVIAALVPVERNRQEATPLRAELQAIAQPAVLLGLATTVLGFGGVFTVFTYVQPL